MTWTTLPSLPATSPSRTSQRSEVMSALRDKVVRNGRSAKSLDSIREEMSQAGESTTADGGAVAAATSDDAADNQPSPSSQTGSSKVETTDATTSVVDNSNATAVADATTDEETTENGDGPISTRIGPHRSRCSTHSEPPGWSTRMRRCLRRVTDAVASCLNPSRTFPTLSSSMPTARRSSSTLPPSAASMSSSLPATASMSNSRRPCRSVSRVRGPERTAPRRRRRSGRGARRRRKSEPVENARARLRLRVGDLTDETLVRSLPKSVHRVSSRSTAPFAGTRWRTP